MNHHKVGVLGLGYVGLPLAVGFGKKYETVGFDVSARRIAELREGTDLTGETTADALASSRHLTFTTDANALKSCDFFVVTVPTPVDEHKQPDFEFLRSASTTVGGVLKKGDIVVYESTVYPGCTEEVCVPILEKISALRLNFDFAIGYSPERINPGDKVHRLETIRKVVSGSTEEAARVVEEMYGSIVEAGTFKASSVRVAEAAKVIENTQRDVNIALINELAMIFDRIGIETRDVLEAARTKWNFLPFEPGLVGGHCIGVDPYYLAYKALSVGFDPLMILAGRKTNDSMGKFVAEKMVKLLIKTGATVRGARVLIVGFTFKEDCPDIRNTKVIGIYKELVDYGIAATIYDPHADTEAARKEYGIDVSHSLPSEQNGIIFAVRHSDFAEIFTPERVYSIIKAPAVIVDVKGRFNMLRDLSGSLYWQL
jgi:UDP-N-acetyl-D-galactosamine dehydrogenase